jgi:hypothetical protein
MNEITLETSLKRDPEQVFSAVDDEVVMLNVDEGKYYGLNKVASKIWGLLANPIKVNAIIEELRKNYDVPYDQCYNETIGCLKEMYKNKLVIVC